MSKIKVLLVDDHALFREGLRALLSDQDDIEIVAEAVDGLDAIQLVPQLLPDIILMDVMMPKMDGAEAVNVLQQDQKTKDIPVIFLTSMITKEEETSQAFGIEIDTKKHQYIAKPFDTPSLVAEIHKALNK